LAERQHWLRVNFNMECSCKACIDNWPLREDLLKMKNVGISNFGVSRLAYLHFHATFELIGLGIFSKIELVENMHSWLLRTLDSDYVFDEDDLRKAFEFGKKIHKCVKEPSPTILLLTEYYIDLMNRKANYYYAPSALT